jgi:DNA-binding NarL/FixJ family response regulator
MTPAILPFAILCGVTMASLLLSILALFRAQSLARATRERAQESRAEMETALDGLRSELSGCAGQVRELMQQPAAQAPGPGMNLSKRSQALRLYRRGDSAGQIAAALRVPLQEVELLLKVQRIVIGSL